MDLKSFAAKYGNAVKIGEAVVFNGRVFQVELGQGSLIRQLARVAEISPEALAKKARFEMREDGSISISLPKQYGKQAAIGLAVGAAVGTGLYMAKNASKAKEKTPAAVAETLASVTKTPGETPEKAPEEYNYVVLKYSRFVPEKTVVLIVPGDCRVVGPDGLEELMKKKDPGVHYTQIGKTAVPKEKNDAQKLFVEKAKELQRDRAVSRHLGIPSSSAAPVVEGTVFADAFVNEEKEWEPKVADAFLVLEILTSKHTHFIGEAQTPSAEKWLKNFNYGQTEKVKCQHF